MIKDEKLRSCWWWEIFFLLFAQIQTEKNLYKWTENFQNYKKIIEKIEIL